jgi:hypothetical protein
MHFLKNSMSSFWQTNSKRALINQLLQMLVEKKKWKEELDISAIMLEAQ